MKRTLAVAIVLATSSLAWADMGTLPGGDTLSFQRLWLHESPCDQTSGNYCSAVEDNLLTDQTQCFNDSGAMTTGMCGGSVDKALPINGVTSPLYAFNFAHCECAFINQSSPIPGFNDGTFTYELQFSGTTQVMKPLDIWVGTTCDDTVQRPLNCHQITNPDPGITYISQLATTGGFAYPEVSYFDIMEPEPSMAGMGCTQRTLTTAEWGLAAINSGTYDFSVSKTITADSEPPPLPTGFTAEGADHAIQISWTPPAAGVGDVFGYQALCETVDDQGNETPALTTHDPPRYQTSRMLCGMGTDATVSSATDLDTGSSAPVDAPPAAPGTLMSRLDPAFICKDISDPTATSMRIEGLQDGVSYVVTFVVVDKSGNSTATYFTSFLTPKPATDFWQDLHNRGSDVQGGFCLIAETYGDDNPLTQALRGFRDDTLGGSVLGRWLTTAYYATLAKLGAVVHGHLVLRIISGVLLLPLVAFALVWHALTLPGLLALILFAIVIYRRRRVRIPRLAVIAALLIVPAHAFAQSPYWENQTSSEITTTTATPEPGSEVSWHAGLRIGPYIPQIDKQFGMSPGPYEQMFGGSSSWLPMADFDRVLFHYFGQVSIGLSVGYMSRSAHAWAVCQPSDVGCIDTPGDPNRTRSTGDKTSFHLLPTALTASYRLTVLDDDYGVPIVPYARAGLGYYIWWIDGTSGDVSTVAGNSAKGASLGFTASVGLSIRAERIDSDAARSMRDSGIEHAGFFAEFQGAWIDGFGKSSKLSVGDNTWFAGFDFEF